MRLQSWSMDIPVFMMQLPHGVTVTTPDGAIMTYCDSADGEYTAEEIMLTDVGTSVVYWKASVGEQEVSGTATLSVTPAVVTVRVLDQRVRVGAEVPSLENPAENTDYTVTGLLGDDALTGLVLHYATTPNTDTAGATYAIQASGASAGSNYTIQYVEGTLTVTSGSASHSGASYAITVPEKVDHGTVTASHRSAKKGRTVTVTALPDSGYILRTLTVTDPGRKNHSAHRQGQWSLRLYHAEQQGDGRGRFCRSGYRYRTALPRCEVWRLLL